MRGRFYKHHPAFSAVFFRTQQLLNGNLVNSCQFQNLRSACQIPSAFPIHQSRSGNSTAFSNFVLRQFLLLPQKVQPSAIRVATSLWFPAHAYRLSHPPHRLILHEVVAFGLCEATFFILWPLLTLKFKRNGRNISATKLSCWWLVTLWLSLFVSVAHAGQPTSSNDTAPAIQQTSGAVSTTPTTTAAQPQLFDCSIWLFLFIIIIAGIFIGMLLYLLCKLGFCGNKGNQPPQAPNNGNGNNVVFKSNLAKANMTINTNIPLPTTIFYLNNGVVVSNSAGLANGTFPPFISVNGMSVPNGSEISTLTPGITTPPSIAFWIETNTCYDANLDPTHAYVGIYNYSVLTTTNLTGNWRELCTVIGWINNNAQVPLICSITYTNGTAMTTNWSQCYVNNYHQPTNIVVYGTLPSLNVENPPGYVASSSTSSTAVRPAGGPIPPGPGGDGGCTNCPPLNSSAQLYKLTCNTNDIVTSWP